MQITVSSDRQSNGQAAATLGAKRLREVLEKRGEANVSVATGASQFEFLQALLREKDIAWDKVTFFHLDEYVGLPLTHPASFRKYLWKRLHSKLPVPPSVFHYVAGDGDAEEECRRLGALISDHPIDVCFAGV
ncbi:MAG: glucosamine-6-phosphate deaminase, partial [Verrucomicrobiales bacterium]